MTDPRRPIVDDFQALAAELTALKRRLDVLETPTGTSTYQTVAKLQRLVNDIQAQLNDYIANGTYNKSQIDNLFATHTQDQSRVTGTWDKPVNTTGGITAQGPVLFPNVYATDLTGTRRTGWVQNDGRMGYASSSERSKTRIRHADEERLSRILEAEPRSFMYRKEIARRTSERINNGVDYRPAVEVGLLAEELDRLGLGEFVYHDENGRAEGIEYSMLVLPLLAVTRDHEQRLRALEGDEG